MNIEHIVPNIDLLQSLNPQQQQVVQHTRGPLLVLAGAGSGKTRSVIHRVAWLITQVGVKPWNILVVTFTNKAAGELRERLEKLSPPDHNRGVGGGRGVLQSSWVGTFHSICVRILRYEIDRLPQFTADFTIFSRDDQVALTKKVLDFFEIDKKEMPAEKVVNLISKLKSNLIVPENYWDNRERNPTTELFYTLYTKYTEMIQSANAMDFDDLLLNAVLLFERHPDVKAKYQEQFQYIMIDEYQDTNYLQFRLVRLLAESHQNICVVGDDDQAIYGWRGANIANILSFEKDYQNVTTIKLEQNYRSSQKILALANHLIKKNKNRHPKALWSENISEHKPQLLAHDNEYSEVNYIADEVALKLAQGVTPSEIVVLYRTNFQSRLFESIFAARGIPYQLIGSYGFFKRAEIKDMLAWLRFLVNPDDLEACLRIINTPPRGIGKTSIDHLIRHCFESGQTVIQALDNVENIHTLTSAGKKALRDFYSQVLTIHNLCSAGVNNPSPLHIQDIVKTIITECHLFDYYKQLDTRDMTDKVENILEFITATTEFDAEFFNEYEKYPELSDYLNALSLKSDVDEYDNKRETVKLMTLHCVKGLEFEYVYIAGLEEGVLPHILCLDKENEVEEERRLLYVGITRAKKEVQMHYSYSRRVAGKPKYQMPSRFLKDLSDDVVDRCEMRNAKWEMKPVAAISNRHKVAAISTSPHSTSPVAAISTSPHSTSPVAAISNRHKVAAISTPPDSPSLRGRGGCEADGVGEVASTPNSHTPPRPILESEKYYKIGQKVQHIDFGEGQILSVDGKGRDAMLTISFDTGKLKKIKGNYVFGSE